MTQPEQFEQALMNERVAEAERFVANMPEAPRNSVRVHVTIFYDDDRKLDLMLRPRGV